MKDRSENGIAVRLLALGCAVCPVCICARTWPRSRFARAVARIEKLCPMCRAYRKLHAAAEPKDG